MSRAEVLELALKLPAGDRAALADDLLASLGPEGDGCTDQEWETAWGDEIRARLGRLGSGESATQDSAEVLAEIRGRRRPGG